MNKKILDLLYRSFENTLTPRQRELLDSTLERSEELRQEQARTTAARQIITENSRVSFKPFFTERVMRRIQDLQKKLDPAFTFFESFVYMFRRVAFVGVIAVIVLFSVQLFYKDNETSEINETISKMTLDDVLSSAFSPSLEDIL
ncbi:hypothetical protein JXQ31_07210 [candidate division KSB1 bacterium]|nr:hypothetical protein [candidate division KSB1 bacterium]